ncbi:ATP dependent DNA ligase [Stratiformator vulcanicus]|uniref:DNA ligase (ATP) n=1 Tax=Stratiformator vulcanicus TaxID=2527980 RepID=A0A517QYR7_9PLAN|nr:hypothetical protein [Stratiformator vulcanicus]QDT36733.1 hypothetical protein Pan189_10960 [Stratiformator vulcanicus]
MATHPSNIAETERLLEEIALANHSSHGDPGKHASAASSAPPMGFSSESKAPACPGCRSHESWGSSSFCPRCGYYPALDSQVDLSGEQEGLEDDTPLSIWTVIPSYAWLALFGAAFIFLVSGLAAALWPIDSPVRATWSLAQTALGSVLLLSFHVAAYIHACRRSDRFGALDLLLSPFGIWKETLTRLPDGVWRFWGAVWSLMAIIAALTLIGALDFNSLFEDWGVRQRASVRLRETAAEAQQNADASLEESIEGAAATAMPAEEEEEQTNAEPKRQSVECLIVGYVPSREGFSWLLLASVIKGDLVYVGRVPSSDIGQEEYEHLIQRMTDPRLQTHRPIVPIGAVGIWLRPKLACTATTQGWTVSKRLRNPKFGSLLAELH